MLLCTWLLLRRRLSMKFISRDYQAVIEAVNASNPFLRDHNLQIVSLEAGKAVARMDGDPDVLNIYGMVHGGALFSLADMAAGVCALTSSVHVVTLNSSIQFLAGARPGPLEAVATALHAGSHTGVYEVRITDSAQKLCAIAEFTMYFYQENRPSLSSPSPAPADQTDESKQTHRADLQSEPRQK